MQWTFTSAAPAFWSQKKLEILVLVKANTRKATVSQDTPTGKKQQEAALFYLLKKSLVEKCPKIQRNILPSLSSAQQSQTNHSWWNYVLITAGGGKQIAVKNAFRNRTRSPIRRQQGLSQVIVSAGQSLKAKNFSYQESDFKHNVSVGSFCSGCFFPLQWNTQAGSSALCPCMYVLV